MRRRTVLTTGIVLASGAVAGCLGSDNDEGSESTPTPAPEEDDQTTEPPDEPEGGEISFSVDSSATEIDWGEEYSVDVTLNAGDDPPVIATVIIYRTEGDSQWSGSISGTQRTWQIEAGDTVTETFMIEPPAVGELSVGLMNVMDEEVVKQWDVEVLPPTAAFGEPISFYDGLELTLDAELHEWMDFELHWSGRDESGVYSVRPNDGQWVKVSVEAENTNTNEAVSVPEYGEFSGLSGNSQLDQPRYLGEGVGAGTAYEIDDETRHEEGARLEWNHEGNPAQEGFWIPPDELISGAVQEGWLVFVTETDKSVEDIEIRVERNDIRATWG